MVFRRIGGMPVIKTDMKAVQILLAASSDLRDKLLRRNACFFCRNHDRCAMCIVSTDKMNLITLHALKPYPDIGLDIFHNVTNVEGAVGVGQGSSNKQLAVR